MTFLRSSPTRASLRAEEGGLKKTVGTEAIEDLQMSARRRDEKHDHRDGDSDPATLDETFESSLDVKRQPPQ